MRPNLTMMVLALAILAGACAPKQVKPATTPTTPVATQKPAQTVPQLPEATKPPTPTAPETLEQRLKRLEKEQMELLKNDPRLKEIQERAAVIEEREARKRAFAKMAEEDTPAMKEARKELQKEHDRRASFVKETREARQRAAISGCNSEMVWVSPRATQFSRFNVMASIRITNHRPFPVNIESNRPNDGVVVRELCPGGSMTIAFARGVLGDPSETITLTAISRPPASEIITETLSFTLNASDAQYRRVDSRTWELNRRY